MVVCLKFCPIVCGGSVFGICYVLHYLVSFLVLQSSSRGKESWLIALIVATVSVVLLFLTVPWVGLQCVIVKFPDHTHFLSE